MGQRTTEFVGRTLAFAVFIAGLVVATGHAAAQGTELVVNGGFELPALPGSTNYVTKRPNDALTGWQIGPHSIDHVKTFWQPAQGQHSLDLNGDRPGSISQTLQTVAGRNYRLRFKYSGHPDRGGNNPTMTVRLGSVNLPPITFNGQSSKSNMGWVQFDQEIVNPGAKALLQFISNDKNHPYGVALDDISVVDLTPPFATPVLIRAVDLGSNKTGLIGRVDGAPNTQITVQAYSAAACTNGVLVNPGAPVPTTPVPPATTVTTDANGYFAVEAPIAAGTGIPPVFVTAAVTSPGQSGQSICLVSSPDNHTWPNALALGAGLTASHYIDAPGKSRWYKFDILPGQKIKIELENLPADYDLGAFKDILAAFQSQLAPTNTSELTRLGAEFAPSVFSPSVFSPSVFSPSVFSPEAYAPSVFSATEFSPSVFSPSVFSPSVFSPSVFSPSVFSPSVFSPSVFSPSVFSPSVAPSVFSPSVFSADELAKAFSSAQTTSIIGVSATAGTGNELVVVNSWNNTGSFYLRVASRGGAFSTGAPFTLKVTKDLSECNGVNPLPPSPRTTVSGYQTVILTDYTNTKLLPGAPVPGGPQDDTFAEKLEKLAAAVSGVVVDVGADARVQQLKVQAGSKPQCPYATNLLAEEIKAIVDSYRPSLRYIVIAGGDDAVPFFRYPDQSLLGQESGYFPPLDSNTASDASLRRDFVLSQDTYGAGTQVSLRTSAFPVPGLAVGRLVETAAEIAGMIDAYTDAGGVVSPKKSLVTGYDFLEDAANAVKTELEAGIGTGAGTLHESLITSNDVSPQKVASSIADLPGKSWTADLLRQKWLAPGSRHDVVFLAGHFSANSALAADFATSLVTTEVAASTTNLKNALVFSAGCHSGYNIVDAHGLTGVTLGLDWAQAMAQKQATLVAGTGYQYGDTDFLEYSERLYRNFARRLRETGTVTVGEALVKAKRDYLAATPDIRGIHEKALLEATLFGLPMLQVNMAVREAISTAGPVIDPDPVVAAGHPRAPLGLQTFDLTVPSSFKPNCCSDQLKMIPGGTNVSASWLEGPDGVVSNPAEPALPLDVVNVTPAVSGLVLRGVGFRGGQFSDSTVVALTGAATTELRGVHVPFVSPVFFPMRTWSINHWGALANQGGTSLLVTPVQHRALDIAQGTSTRRQYSNLELRLYYSGIPPGNPDPKLDLSKATLADAPTIVKVEALPAPGGGIDVTAQVIGDPKAAIHEVWITYTSNGANAWTSLSLAQCVTPLPAACGSTADSSVWKGHLATSPPNFKFVVQAASGLGLVTLDDNFGLYYSLGGAGQTPTTVTLISHPPSATFGEIPTIVAELKKTSGELLSGKSVTIAIGGAARIATTGGDGRATVNLPVVVVPSSGYQIVASFSGDEIHLPAAASFSPFTVNKVAASLAVVSPTPPVVTLSAPVGNATQYLAQESVKFTILQGGVEKKQIWVITDYLGRAALPSPGLPAGAYTLQADFAGNATYAATTTSLPFSLAPQTITFGGGGLPASLTIPGTAQFTATSESGQPVRVVLSPNPSPHCTLSFANGQYTLTALTIGTCTVVASADGTITFGTVQVTQPITIVGTPQTVTLNVPSLEYLQTAALPASTNAPAVQPITWTATGPCSVSGNVLTANSGTGSCQLAATAPGTSVYAPFSKNDFPPIALTKKAQQITMPLSITPSSPTFGDGTFTVAATAPGGTVSFSVQQPSSVCTMFDATRVSILTAGTCTVEANQAGNANYAPAATVTQPVSINKAQQAITFGALADKLSNAPPFAVSATASSGLAVTFSVSGVCTVSGGTVTLSGVAGTCTVTASQLGNVNYFAAVDVLRPFNVTRVGALASAGSMAQPRSHHTATPLCDQRILVAGGFDDRGQSTATSELYTHGAPTPWSTQGNMPSKSAGHAAVLVGITAANRANPCSAPGNTRVVAFAGGNSSTDIYVPASGTWSPGGGMGSTRSFHTATRLQDGRVFIVGGSDNGGKTLDSTVIYDPVTGNFTDGPTLSPARERHTATLLSTGEVLIAGGRRKVGNNYQILTSTVLLDVNGSPITTPPAPSLGQARFDHQALAWIDSLVANSAALIIGGADATANLASAEIYKLNPSAVDQWVTAGNLGTARREHTATGVGGLVLIAGGRAPPTSAALASTELYFGGAFFPFTNLTTARYAHTATPFTIGGTTRVLIVGGVGTDGKAKASAELYQ